jgi:hypothetical protein
MKIVDLDGHKVFANANFLQQYERYRKLSRLFYFSAQSGKLTKGVRQQSQKALPIMAAFANLRKNRLLWSQL